LLIFIQSFPSRGVGFQRPAGYCALTSFVHFRSSPERIARVDRARRSAIHRELCKVITSIQHERNGLTSRLEWARVRAASLIGTEDGSSYEREPVDEERICAAESQMMSAAARLIDLNKERDLFERLLAQIPVQPAAPEADSDLFADADRPHSEPVLAPNQRLKAGMAGDGLARAYRCLRSTRVLRLLWASFNSERILTSLIIGLTLLVVMLR
jgi:hypothetical protein